MNGGAGNFSKEHNIIYIYIRTNKQRGKDTKDPEIRIQLFPKQKKVCEQRKVVRQGILHQSHQITPRVLLYHSSLQKLCDL